MEAVDIFCHIFDHVRQLVQMLFGIIDGYVIFKLDHSAVVFVGYN